MRTLVIGDIHGELDKLKDLISLSKPNLVYSVGDLIDRGSDSYGVVKFCIENDIKPVLGNHELMFIQALDTYFQNEDLLDLKFSDWWLNGGERVFNRTTKSQLKEMLDYFKSLPVVYTLEQTLFEKPVLISHSMTTHMLELDLEPKAHHFDLQMIFPLVWNRDTIPYKMSPFHNIHGHTPTDYAHGLEKKPFQSEWVTNLDTGAAYGGISGRGKLTGIILEENKFYRA